MLNDLIFLLMAILSSSSKQGADSVVPASYASSKNATLQHALTMPCNMALTQSYEEKRDLLISQLYKRSNTTVASRSYTYDTLGRPMSRSTSKDGSTVNDSFGYNSRSELNTATVNNEAYAYDYDNIGNRETAQEAAEFATTYESNQLNQYTAISDFESSYDDAGNQTKVKTSTGIWSVVYNAENCPTSFTNADSGTIVECTYDYMGRRATKKVTTNGAVTLHQRYIYRGYLQIACCDLTRSSHPCLWLLTWDPSQIKATRPLAIRKDGTWFAYGWDLTKNICEVFEPAGYIRTAYTYSLYGKVSESGDITQPLQWSSECLDTELALTYYNFRHYNSLDGRWISRDKEGEMVCRYSLYNFLHQSPTLHVDSLGLDMIDTVCDYSIKTWQVKEEYKKCTERCVNQRTREIYGAQEFHDSASGANSSIVGPNVGEGAGGPQGVLVLLALIYAFVQYKVCMDECEKNYRNNKPNLQLCI